MAGATISRRDVLRWRFLNQGLHHPSATASDPAGVALLDYGVQDTGTDGAGWALANRGVAGAGGDDLAFAWTLRGAPHAYRRSDLAAVAVATAPWSEADAAKRIFDASKPLKAAGIAVLDALRVLAGFMRDLAAEPIVKGEISSRLAGMVDEPYLRYCRPCDAIHLYEMPFRLAALQAGLELEPGTSPPVLRRIPKLRPPAYGHLGGEAEASFDVVRNHLRFYGAARVRDVAEFVDAPLKEIQAHWPDDAVEVRVDDVPAAGKRDARFALAGDLEAIASGGPPATGRVVRLLAPHDAYLQLRDRELLVGDEGRRKDLWRPLGRPGAIVADGEILGTWRPRAAGRRLTVRLEAWVSIGARDRALVEEEAERLAAYRGVTLAGVDQA
ncbi:MAG: DNA glycosylase AlkZ-like family protein [Acidimicrobiia bacterium]